MKRVILAVFGLAAVGFGGNAHALAPVPTKLKTRVEQAVANRKGIYLEASTIHFSGSRGNPLGAKKFSGIGLTAPRLGAPLVKKYRVTGTVQRSLYGLATVRNIKIQALPVIQNW